MFRKERLGMALYTGFYCREYDEKGNLISIPVAGSWDNLGLRKPNLLEDAAMHISDNPLSRLALTGFSSAALTHALVGNTEAALVIGVLGLAGVTAAGVARRTEAQRQGASTITVKPKSR